MAVKPFNGDLNLIKTATSSWFMSCRYFLLGGTNGLQCSGSTGS